MQNFAEAIGASLGAFKETDENFKILVLFTDGEDNETGALEAAQKAAQAGMRIFTVGVGTANGELLRVRDEQGEQGTLPDSQISSAWRGVTFSSPNVAHAAGESAAAPRGPRPLALRAGEQWQPRLLELIEDADVFQLFWSGNSMDSRHCRIEWEHALRLHRPQFISAARTRSTSP